MSPPQQIFGYRNSQPWSHLRPRHHHHLVFGQHRNLKDFLGSTTNISLPAALCHLPKEFLGASRQTSQISPKGAPPKRPLADPRMGTGSWIPAPQTPADPPLNRIHEFEYWKFQPLAEPRGLAIFNPHYKNGWYPTFSWWKLRYPASIFHNPRQPTSDTESPTPGPVGRFVLQLGSGPSTLGTGSQG